MADISGRGRDAVAVGIEAYALSQKGQGFDANGSSKVRFKPASIETHASFTASLWFKSDQASYTVNTGLFHNNSKKDFQIDFNGSMLRYNGVSVGKHNLSEINANQWYHLAVVSDGSTTQVYLDGVKLLDEAGADNDFGDYAIGVNRGNKLFFDGQIDEVLVYKRALKEVELIDVYKATK